MHENTPLQKSLIIPVILSGGSGSRLWPVSREDFPKPFMKLPDGQTLLEKTYRRVASLPNVHKDGGKVKVLTVTNRDYYFMSRDELEKAEIKGSFLLEPFSRNTGPAIALAAHRINYKFGSNALMLVLPADHLILDEAAFFNSVEEAIKLANAPHGHLVTFGIVPSGPETGFGYINVDQIKIEGGYKVLSFVEKPEEKMAQAYVADGNYLWNSGMFCFGAGQFLQQLQLCAPEFANAAQDCWNSMQYEGSRDLSMIEIPGEAFGALPNISVDYAVMERSNKVAVVPGDFGWSDIGSWGAVQNLISPDENNNRASGEAIFVKSFDTFVQSEHRLVAVVGLNDLMVIETKDAILVVSNKHAQDVKSVVNLLKNSNHDSYKLHSSVLRPWGTYVVLEDMPGFKIKRIEVKPGGKLSLQSHERRSEHWIVVRGQAFVINDEQSFTVFANQSTYIPAGHKHRLENRTDDDLVIIEVQCGDYLKEDDIVRYEDDYGRL